MQNFKKNTSEILFENIELKSLVASFVFCIEKEIEYIERNNTLINWRLKYYENSYFKPKKANRISVEDFCSIFVINKEHLKIIRNFCAHFKHKNNLNKIQNNFEFIDLNKLNAINKDIKIEEFKIFWNKITQNKTAEYFWLKIFFFVTVFLKKSDYESNFKKDFLYLVEEKTQLDHKLIEKEIKNFENIIQITRRPVKDLPEQIFWLSKWSSLVKELSEKKSKNHNNYYSIFKDFSEQNYELINVNKEESNKLKKRWKNVSKKLFKKKDEILNFKFLIQNFEQASKNDNDIDWKIRPICPGSDEKQRHYLMFKEDHFKCEENDCHYHDYEKLKEKKNDLQFTYFWQRKENKITHFSFEYKDHIFKISYRTFCKVIIIILNKIVKNKFFEVNELNIDKVVNEFKLMLEVLKDDYKNIKKIFFDKFEKEKYEFKRLKEWDLNNFKEKFYLNLIDGKFNNFKKAINLYQLWENKLKIKRKKLQTFFQNNKNQIEYLSLNELYKLRKQDNLSETELKRLNNTIRKNAVLMTKFLTQKICDELETNNKENVFQIIITILAKNFNSEIKITNLLINEWENEINNFPTLVNKKDDKEILLNFLSKLIKNILNLNLNDISIETLLKKSVKNKINEIDKLLELINKKDVINNDERNKINDKFKNFIYSLFQKRKRFPPRYLDQIVIDWKCIKNFYKINDNNEKFYSDNYSNKLIQQNQSLNDFFKQHNIDFFKTEKTNSILFLFFYFNVYRKIEELYKLNSKIKIDFDLEDKTKRITDQKIKLSFVFDENKTKRIIFDNIKVLDIGFLIRYNLFSEKKGKSDEDDNLLKNLTNDIINFQDLKNRINLLFPKEIFLKKIEETTDDIKENIINQIKTKNKFIKRKDLIKVILIYEKKKSENKWDYSLKEIRNKLLHCSILKTEDCNKLNFEPFLKIWINWIKKIQRVKIDKNK